MDSVEQEKAQQTTNIINHVKGFLIWKGKQ